MTLDLRRRRLLQAGTLAALSTALPGFARTQVFDAATTAEQATAGLDLRGRTIVVTGCNSGIGQETMHVLALRGAHVIGTARSRATGETACAAVEGRATPVVLDLADFDSVLAASDTIRAFDVPVDALVCNAGVVLDALEQVRGIEKTFVVNHLGHYLLVRRLLDRVTAAPEGRVVVLGSGDERNAPPGGIQFDDLSGANWDARYAHSKLANGLFSLELSRRLASTRATSNCVSPGHTRSNILRNVGSRYRDDARSVQQGAATPCWLAASPAASGINGAFYRDFAPAPQSDAQRDAAMAARLWAVSESLVGDWLPG
ncbi:SDR family NAD(P)-dependent oxidoreductase [Luteimonas sp. 3794]|uniref:SDR family NAD(P)-dependent oxidoreductase n=1 Tax=Luteimonas sp. 3794 TaxID=2817730 RepID=UPI002856482F|nr:SDR family NAD(P)-dependent oxidoreductase [Luteimonas sp. 3794]MDR6992646.1 NAD(P)-dependent dehydrogenase (short-subunit alcohol dehydrogenase family) [Luteimonas sp. 3794]